MRIGGYEVMGVLGRGGMGTVFRARSAAGEEVALKLIARPGGDRAARFERERRLLSAFTLLDGFVTLLDGGEAPEGAFIVMPLMTGGTLRDRLEKGPLGVERTVELGRSLGRSLARAHAKGIVHRDLKPENILYDAGERPLIADLGLAKHFDKDQATAAGSMSLSRQGGFRGTAGYAPPEQADDAKSVGPASDIFALAAILHECLTGSPAFTGDNVMEILARMANGAHERIPREVAPSWLASVIDRALDPDPKKRPADAARFLEALQEPAPRPRSRAPLAIGALVVVAASLGVAFALGRGSPAPQAPAPGAKGAPPAPVIPRWYAELPESERPPLPLPAAVQFGKAKGDYVAAKDPSLELVFVPGGSFKMGDDQYEGEPNRLPVHTVELSPFFIGKFEVTIGQFREFAKTLKAPLPRQGWGYFHRTPAYPLGDPRRDQGMPIPRGELRTKPLYHALGLTWDHPFWDPPGEVPTPVTDQLPASLLTGDDALAYVAWLGLDLPTEAQWEYAAVWDRKAGRRVGKFAWGDDIPSATSPKFANLIDLSLIKKNSLTPIFPGYDDGVAYAAPVGQFPKDRSPSGVYDMTGNVREIVKDLWDADYYRRSPAKDPCCTDGNQDGVHSLRGGSWGWHCGEDAGGTLSLAARDPNDYCSNVIGFRVAAAVR